MAVYEAVNLVSLQHCRLFGNEFCARYDNAVSEVINSVTGSV